MTSTTDRLIASLRAHHDRLAGVVDELTPEQLDGPSAAEKWSIAQVLSHLGSGAEIFGTRYAAAIAGVPPQPQENQTIWARWDDSSSQEQAAGFLEHDEVFVARVEALDEDQRSTLQVDLGFGPDQWPLETALVLRLNEVAAHTWDVLAGLDAAAPLDDEAAGLLLAAYAGPAAFMTDWAGKPDQLDASVVLAAAGHTVRIDDALSFAEGESDDATATLHAPREALLRLVLGRLKDGYTAPDTTVEGNTTLEDLRKVFPGF